MNKTFKTYRDIRCPLCENRITKFGQKQEVIDSSRENKALIVKTCTGCKTEVTLSYDAEENVFEAYWIGDDKAEPEIAKCRDKVEQIYKMLGLSRDPKYLYMDNMLDDILYKLKAAGKTPANKVQLNLERELKKSNKIIADIDAKVDPIIARHGVEYFGALAKVDQLAHQYNKLLLPKRGESHNVSETVFNDALDLVDKHSETIDKAHEIIDKMELWPEDTTLGVVDKINKLCLLVKESKQAPSLTENQKRTRIYLSEMFLSDIEALGTKFKQLRKFEEE